MTDWLDDLSEDWVSQPPSSPPASLSKAPNNGGGHHTNPSVRNAKLRRNILSERTASRDNSRMPSVSEENFKKSTRRGLSRRSLSAESAQSPLGGSVVVHKQVERKSVSVSPPKSRRSEDTPEWKRRLLGGEMGYGEQKDLFSPRGIESIFQKPPPGRKESFREGSRGLSFLKNLDSVPSSPPPWPSDPTPSNGSPTKSVMGTMRELEAVHEEEEESLDYRFASNAGNGLISHASGNGAQVSRLDIVKGREGGKQTTAQRAVQNSPTTTSRIPSKSATSSRVVSGRSEQSSDDLSPVFISKHNTADGRISYAALDLSRSQLERQLQQLRDSQQSHARKVSVQSQRISEIDDPSLARLQSENLPEDLPAGTPEVVSIGEFVSVRRGGLSPDGSFFRRPLSPSPLRHVSGSTAFSATTGFADGTASIAGLQSRLTQRQSSLPEDTVVRHPNATSQAETEATSQKSQDTQETAVRIVGRKHSAITEIVQLHATQNVTNSQQTGCAVDGKFQFGQGHFAEYSFPDDLSSCSLREEDSGASLASRSPPSSVLPPGSQQPRGFRVETPEADDRSKLEKRKSSKPSIKGTLSVRKRSAHGDGQNSVWQKLSNDSQVQPIALNADGKRPPTSPFKSPTPKRRRTLVTSDVLQDMVDDVNISVQASHNRAESFVGKKRKDARYDGQSNVADPETLAQRHILRPRNPTPSQRRRQEVEEQLREAAEHLISSSPRLEVIKEHLGAADSEGETSEMEKARLVASEVAAFSEKVAHGMADHGRKRSVTTQDFLDEATKIMNFIRNKGAPNSGLASLVESDLENRTPEEIEEPSPPTSPLSISRPPTREGLRSGWRARERKLDARVVSHLKKYQDAEDEGFVGSSLRSSKLDAEVDRVAYNLNRIESDPPGLRIIEPNLRRHTRRDSEGTNDGIPSHRTDTSDRPATQSSHTTAESSLGRTTASQKSENVATLAPEVVAHLIPQEVAGMTFDQEKGIWVKARSPRKGEFTKEDVENLSQSEEDPFNGIPDLTVDEMRESENLKTRPITPLPHPANEDDVFGPQSDSGSSTQNPVHSGNLDNEDSIRSSVSDLQQRSKGDGGQYESAKKPFGQSNSKKANNSKSSPMRNAGNGYEEVEHEYSILEGRSKPKHHRLSELKVSISSQYIQLYTTKADKTKGRNADSTNVILPERCHSHENPYDQAVSVKVPGTVAAPPTKSQIMINAPSSPGHADVTFYMSELPEFTVNQVDEREIQNRPLVKRTGGFLVQGKEDRFAWGNHLLAKALQDVEPNNDWEDLREVDLHGKNITSLHILDVVCERLEKLNISSNELCQLSGAPSMIRSLNARHNLLTSLTSWAHLSNLQYLDVSNNNIDTLRGFGCLLHLRELKADNNQIKSLEGIEQLDALLSLSLRSNKLSIVDLAGYEL